MNSQLRPAAEVGSILADKAISARRTELEAVISEGLQTFVEVGTALLEIRDSKLYRPDFATFEDYCQVRWGMTRQSAYRLIASAGIVKAFESLPSPPKVKPFTESQIRPLATLPKERQAEAWNAAVKSAKGKQPTGKQVQREAHKIAPPKLTPEEELLASGVMLDPEPARESGDIASQRQSGLIPPNTPVADEQIDDDEQTESEVKPDVNIGLDDEAFLAACPTRTRLEGILLERFEREVLLYKALTPLRMKYYHQQMHITSKQHKANKNHNGPYYLNHTRHFRPRHPKDWTACAVCRMADGISTGRTSSGECQGCKGNGYYAY